MWDKKNAFLVKLFLRCYVLAILNSAIFKISNECLFHSSLTNPIELKSKYEQFLLGVILAPIFETWLLQYLPNLLLIKLKVNNKYLLILLPAILFGTLHIGYSLIYGICMVIFGIIINYFYLKSKQVSKKYFWLTVMLHAMYNMLGILL
jgi:Type II CAAX prenyl endopeptidase Rce1-like